MNRRTSLTLIIITAMVCSTILIFKLAGDDSRSPVPVTVKDEARTQVASESINNSPVVSVSYGTIDGKLDVICEVLKELVCQLYGLDKDGAIVKLADISNEMSDETVASPDAFAYRMSFNVQNLKQIVSVYGVSIDKTGNQISKSTSIPLAL